jgi:hypothetical protein
MKRIILLLSLVIFNLFAYSQATRETRPAFSPCRPVTGIDYSENIRKPIQPFNFQTLHFETQYDFYLKVTIDIEANGVTIVNIQDDYFAQTTTIKSVMDKNDFANLMLILARCDFDSFREEPIVDDLKCCKSFFEISFNGQVYKASGCAFSPFDNRELEHALLTKMHTQSDNARIRMRDDVNHR